MEILQKYPELLQMEGAVTRNADGMIEIADWAMKELQQQKEQIATNAQAAAIMQAGVAAQKKAYAEQVSVAQDIGTNSVTHYDAMGNAYTQTMNTGDILAKHASELSNLTADEYTALDLTCLDYYSYNSQIGFLSLGRSGLTASQYSEIGLY